MQLKIALGLATFAWAALGASPLRVEVSWEKPLDGRVILILAHRSPPEPRAQVSELLSTAQIFGVDVEGARSAAIDGSTLGYPLETLDHVPAGEYFAQAVVNVYETFRRADGHTVKLPPDRGEGQHWNRKPGNLYSEPVRVRIDPGSSTPVRLSLTKTMPELPAPQDTKYVHRVKLQSKLLTAFWGRPMYLGAMVVTPDGFQEHPERRYPVVYYQNHYTATFSGFQTEPPSQSRLAPAYRFYEAWTAGKLPRMLIVVAQDANPYYDDSYAVNSANLGPYGDALVEELYPYIEREFHAIGQPWARALYGGSTGGWRALAQQIFHPDFFNGVWAETPDPIDFRAYLLVNIYEDGNAFYHTGPWKRVPIPMMHDWEGKVDATMEDAIRFELVLGAKNRSGEQFDIWNAVFSPAGADGYPLQIFDPRGGAIDKQVAAYWKEHYDLVHILQANWATLGPKLVGKIHLESGSDDAFYLYRAVRLAQQFLESTKTEGKQPYYAGSVEFSPGMAHGGAVAIPPPPMPAQSFHERVMLAFAEWIRKSAPAGADLNSWQ